jgi:large subunit ribosomal protein L11|tara:strand:+ start:79 stop:702 length:624 start_codon:yes stop_codon:yes gene_type:complete
MAKEIDGYLKLQIPAGKANPSPPVGPALGQRGINIMDFCKSFNERTKDEDSGMPIPVTITIFKDKSFTFETKTPPASYLLKKVLNAKRGSPLPGRESRGTISVADIKKIAEKKMVDLSANDIDAAVKILSGTARSMGIDVAAKTVKADVDFTKAPTAPKEEQAGEGGQQADSADQKSEDGKSGDSDQKGDKGKGDQKGDKNKGEEKK